MEHKIPQTAEDDDCNKDDDHPAPMGPEFRPVGDCGKPEEAEDHQGKAVEDAHHIAHQQITGRCWTVRYLRAEFLLKEINHSEHVLNYSRESRFIEILSQRKASLPGEN